MGLLNKVMRAAIGAPAAWGDVGPEELADGVLGRDVILAVDQTKMTVGARQGLNYKVICDVVLQVTLSGQAPYQADVRQGIRVDALSQIVPGRTEVVVRVDRADTSKVVVDYALTIVPERANPGPGPFSQTAGGVTYAANRVIDRRKPVQPQFGSAADVLAHGEAVRAEILQYAPYHLQAADGSDIYLVALAVTPPTGPPYGVKLGNPVPDAALPLLTLGRDVPAKRSPSDPKKVVIDWNEVAAEALTGGRPLS